MKVSIEDVNYIAVCQAERTPGQAEKMVMEFESILSHFESIDKFDLSDVQLDFHEGMDAVLREDETSAFENKEKLFKNTKSMSGTYIKVPKIIE